MPDENGTVTLQPGKNAKISLGGGSQTIKIAPPPVPEGMPPPPQPPPPKMPPEPVAEWSDKANLRVDLTKENKDPVCNELEMVSEVFLSLRECLQRAVLSEDQDIVRTRITNDKAYWMRHAVSKAQESFPSASHADTSFAACKCYHQAPENANHEKSVQSGIPQRLQPVHEGEDKVWVPGASRKEEAAVRCVE